MSELESTSAQDTGSEDTAPRNRVTKSPEAFRTISEAANELGLPQHVLRFWESKFPQVKPLKRGGGRRYYRPEDIALLTRIRDWLHVEGYTIKGVQKLLRDPASRNGDVENGLSAPAVGDTGNDTPAEPSIAAVPAASVETRQGIDKAIERLTAIQRDLIKAIGD